MKNLYDKDLCHVGNKALNLNFLYQKGFNIAPGFVLTLPEQSIKLPFENCIVRSNGLGEDGECSFSGIFKSIPFVDKYDLNHAIKEVFESFSSKKYKAYSKLKGCTVKPGVLIQKMIDSKYSAVAHISDQDMYIDLAEGYCFDIVSGRVNSKVIEVKDDIETYKNFKLEIKFYELLKIFKEIKKHYEKTIEVEITFDGLKWWVLQVKEI